MKKILLTIIITLSTLCYSFSQNNGKTFELINSTSFVEKIESLKSEGKTEFTVSNFYLTPSNEKNLEDMIYLLINDSLPKDNIVYYIRNSFYADNSSYNNNTFFKLNGVFVYVNYDEFPLSVNLISHISPLKNQE